MVLPIDPLTGASLVVMALSPREFCAVTKPTEINVVPRTSEVVYDYSKTLSEMQNQAIDTINPYGFGSVSHTNGYMEGQIDLKARVKLGHKQMPSQGAHCVWYESVTVEISIDPKIVIAKEVAQDKCMLQAVARHELKHVKVDRQIVNKYSKTIGHKVYNALKQRGFVAAGKGAENMQATADRMRKTVNQIVELEYKKLEIDRTESQQAVDSLEEYKSVSAQCPDYKMPHTKK